jgi:hypothetical protein
MRRSKDPTSEQLATYFRKPSTARSAYVAGTTCDLFEDENEGLAHALALYAEQQKRAGVR